MNLAQYSLDNTKIVYFFLAVLLIGGILSFGRLGKKEDAPFVIKSAVIMTRYPGAEPAEVERLVTEPISREIQSMSGVYKIKSESMYGLSKITFELQPSLSATSIPQKWDELRRKVLNIQPQLPAGSSVPTVSDDFGDVFGIYYGLVGDDGFSYEEMRNWAERIKTQVITADGVMKVALFGTQTEVIHIFISVNKLAGMSIDPKQLAGLLQSQNQIINTGEISAGEQQLRIVANGTYTTVDDIRNQVITTSGGQVKLGDIAIIEKGYMEPPGNIMHVNGKRAIGIGISTDPTKDVVKTGELVDRRLAELMPLIPVGLELESLYPENVIAKEANNGFIINLIESILIVIVIIMLVMGMRAGVLIGSSLIFSIGGTLLIMSFLGVGLNRTSLAGFIIAMGMLVDNAIVILDGIQVDMQRGIERRTALTGIGRKTAMPLLGATLIAILAFFPIFLSPDTAGIYVRDLFIVLAVSLLLSWILALTLVPVLADKRLKVKGNREGDPYGNSYYRALRSVLNWVLSHRIVSLCVGFGLVAVSLLCFRTLPQGFFPDMDYDQLYIEYKLPEGTNSTQVGEDLHAIENYLLGRSEITHVTTSIGGTPSRYNLVRSIADPSLAYGELIVDYTSPEALTASFDEIQTYLNANYPDAYVRLKRYNLMYKKFPIEVEFSGPDPAVLRDLTAQAAAIMEESPSLQMVTSDWEPKVPVLIVDYNQPVARNIGLSRQDIGLSLMSATDGIPTGTFYEGTESKTIYMRCVDRDGNPIESLEHTPVFGLMPATAGLDRQTVGGLLTGTLSEEEVLASLLSTVPLSQAVNGVHVEWEEPVVIRRNGERAMRAQCIPVPGAAVENARASIAEQIASIELPEGYDMKWEGEKSASNESMKYLFKYYPLAVILMIAILIALFKDYRKPAIIVLCLPLLFIGVIFGMMLSGKTFGFVAIVATLGLVGMLIKNGIVLMDEITLQINAGKEPVDALMESSASRFRPVMLASLTTILGMIPLLGDSLFGPAAVVIMGGLLVGTLITLLFIPVLYALFYRIRIK